MMMPQPQAEHHFLQRMVGEWTCETECIMGPDQPPMTSTATETVRAVGDLWVVAEGKMDGPDGKPMVTMLTLGFDPAKDKFVGTFAASCMTHLWIYEGPRTGDRIDLDTTGPSFTDPAATAPYIDSHEFLDADTRTVTSVYFMPDGKKVQFMKATYKRVK